MPVDGQVPFDGKWSELIMCHSIKEVLGFGSNPEEVSTDMEGAGSESGKRIPVRIPNPLQPSQEEIDEHELTHLPFRSWCRHCVRGKGRVADHTSKVREDGTPELHLDYCFMKSEGDDM